jgi:hypothetical protein
MKKFFWIILLLSIPTFGLMLKPGIYTMHDFHVFRQQQFEKCLIQTNSFPCRWAFDAGMGFGEPVFNFYGQLPYWIGQLFRILSFSILDSVKANFIFSIVASSVAMYSLANKFWSKRGALFSALFYAFAPYRAVDVWVRGALGESLAFVFFPLILLCLKEYVENRRLKYLFWLILAFAGLIITHNLSLMIFLPFALVWFMYFFIKSNNKSIHTIYDLISAGLVTGLLAAFYLLPVIFESGLVTVGETITGYYNFRLHYVTLRQLFLSFYWGYGGSVWGPNDTMSFSLGHFHWISSVAILLLALLRQRVGEVFLFLILAIFAAFLTHGKAEFIWEAIKPMAFIQFPWRFLTMSTLFLSLAAGAVVKFIPKRAWVIILTMAIGFYSGNFRPDIWRNISDQEQFSGKLWDEQRSSALSDFWPKSVKLPDRLAPAKPETILETDSYQKTRYPIVYFPGWTAKSGNKTLEVFPSGDMGLVTVRTPPNSNTILSFKDTPVRKIGNIVSFATLIGLLIWVWKRS